MRPARPAPTTMMLRPMMDDVLVAAIESRKKFGNEIRENEDLAERNRSWSREIGNFEKENSQALN